MIPSVCRHLSHTRGEGSAALNLAQAALLRDLLGEGRAESENASRPDPGSSNKPVNIFAACPARGSSGTTILSTFLPAELVGISKKCALGPPQPLFVTWGQSVRAGDRWDGVVLTERYACDLAVRVSDTHWAERGKT
jgi:hypothetical protein